MSTSDLRAASSGGTHTPKQNAKAAAIRLHGRINVDFTGSGRGGTIRRP